MRCCQGASAALVPAGLRGLAFPFVFATGNTLSPGNVDFHLHPRYRSQTSLDATLAKTQAGLDAFITEKYQDQIAAILAEWSSSLLQSPQDTRMIEGVLTPDFSGSSFQPVESRVVRSGAALEIHQNKFGLGTSLGRDAFFQELKSALDSFSKILVAEFKVVSIHVDSGNADRRDAVGTAGEDAGATRLANGLRTRVRYEIMGSGRDFYREQRVGHWDLEWVTTSTGKFLLKNWRALGDETWSRAADPIYMDIAAQAFAGSPAYSAQLLRGVDYWRTVLDGACGIDVYGHNGVSVGDVDGDGFDDLYVCQPAGLPNRLFHNRRDGTFEDITEGSGVGILENTACALFADVDNDGRQDLIVVRTSGPLLFLNEGGGNFRQKHDAFKFATPPQGTFTGAAVADYDRDGWLDIYFCLYIYYQGTDQYKYPSPYYDAENGPPNFMLRNNRDGTFRDVTAESGLDRNNTRYSFCCGWSDYNRDGWPDLYVVNDFGRKNLYRNNGDGTFTDMAPQAGVEDIGAGMSVCWFDYDNDGAEDLYVADMWSAAGMRVSEQNIFQKDASEKARAQYRKHARGNSLLHNDLLRNNNKDGAFQDTSASAGVEMGRWSWSSDAWDFDHDGYPDLYIANGMISGPSRPPETEDLNSFFWRQVVASSPGVAKPAHDYEQGWNALNESIRSDGTWSGFERNVFYANNRDGTFSDVSGVVGLDFLEDGRAFALSDFDHDGRLEVFLKNRNGPQLRLLKNVTQKLPPSIAFHLRGVKSSRDAIGAAVTVETESGRQTRMLQAGSGFLSQHSKDVFFGLGEATGPVRASIRWPSGLVQELHGLPINHRIWVEEGAEPSRIEAFETQPQGLKRGSLTSVIGTAEAMPSQNPNVVFDALPSKVETWLLAPVFAPDFSLSDLMGQTHTLAALHGKAVLLNFWATGSATCHDDLRILDRVHKHAPGFQLLSVNVDDSTSAENVRALARELHLSLPVLHASDDVAGIYNILYRYLFDRHRDLGLPTSFLINHTGDIVKVYQGPVNAELIEQDFRHIPQTSAERLAQALPFPGVSETSEFRRNYLSYGSVYFQRGYFDQAEASFRLALRDDPGSAEALYGLGSVYLQQQKTAEARASFERVTKLHPGYPDTLPNAWNNLGLLATREGRTGDAIPYFQEALRLSPDHLIALDNLGNAYRQLKQWDEARKILQRAVAVGPDDAEANYSLGLVFAQVDDNDRAYEYLQRALKLRPAYPEALNNLGVLYLRTHRRDEAVASFEECIRVAPAFDQSYLNLARVYALEGAPDKSRTVLLGLLKQHPDNAQAQKMLEQLGR
ncbi:MAG TPA: FG-GAP-like repeat-containing protein [Terriglobales bacterium]|nr:FG-GAP-like repeat-containing protein [Terriglobales bacterium]